MSHRRCAVSRSAFRMVRRIAVPFSMVVCLATAFAPAQCATQWQHSSIAGSNGSVSAATWWDRDGAGPLPAVPVIGGSFSIAGSRMVHNVAWFDAASNEWQALGSGLDDGDATALATMPNGDLIVGGSFTRASGVAASHIARWDGVAWSALGAGVNGNVVALTVLLNGDLVAGGGFTAAGAVSASYVARWDGAAWSALGSGMHIVPPPFFVFPPVRALLTLPNGDLIAGGGFTHAGAVAASCVARWDGNAWSALGSGVVPLSTLPLGGVDALTVLPNGDLIAGGNFDIAGGITTHSVARWDGSAWSPLANGIIGQSVEALAAGPSGEVLAAAGSSGVMRWDGASWTSIGGPAGYVLALASDGSGAALAGGTFAQPGSNVALWTGSAWSALGAPGLLLGLTGPALAVTERPNGDLIVGGPWAVFGQIGLGIAGGMSVPLARWNGSNWSPVAVVMTPAPFPSNVAQVDCLATLGNGDVVVGGEFSQAWATYVPPGFSSGTTAIARWDGSSWSSVGGGVGTAAFFTSPSVAGIVPLPGDGFIAVGHFQNAGSLAADNIARWDGATWRGFGNGLAGSSVNAAVVLTNGDVVAGGSFLAGGSTPAGNVAEWNGALWGPLGSGVNGEVWALAALPNGDVIAGGHFDHAGGTPARNIARWDGNAWSSLGNGLTSSCCATSERVKSLLALPNGDVLAVGEFDLSGGVQVDHIARWDGSAWSPVDGGLGGGEASALVMRANGEIVAVGRFATAGSAVSPTIAVLRSACPAHAVPVGAGCTGSGGLNRLVASGQPWTGSTFVTTALGMPDPGVAVFLYGLAPLSTPLSNLLPWALPGCGLSVMPVVAIPQLVMAGSATTVVQVQTTPALVGMQVLEQVLAVGTDTGGNIVQVTSTNALQITIGSF